MSAVYNAKVAISRMGHDDQIRVKWCNVGTAFEVSEGQINLVLDTLPVDNMLWNGNIVLFKKED
jgi:hypothetical protein